MVDFIKSFLDFLVSIKNLIFVIFMYDVMFQICFDVEIFQNQVRCLKSLSLKHVFNYEYMNIFVKLTLVFRDLLSKFNLRLLLLL